MFSRAVSLRKPLLTAHLPRRLMTSVHDPQAGRIELICGPMFSGKTTELFRRLRRHERAGRSVLLLKFAGDSRYIDATASDGEGDSAHLSINDKSKSRNTEAVTHNNDRFAAIATDTISALLSPPLASASSSCSSNGAAVSAAAVTTNSADSAASAALEAARARLRAAEVVGVDEGQFFPDLALAAEALAAAGKTVVVAALDGDFRREPFPAVAALLPKVEAVSKILAVCKRCGADAPFSARYDAVALDIEEIMHNTL